MAYRHCNHCGEGLKRPTLKEDLVDKVYCPRCHTVQLQDRTVQDWMVDLDDRLRELETRFPPSGGR